jgi:hypothetical protein
MIILEVEKKLLQFLSVIKAELLISSSYSTGF